MRNNKSGNSKEGTAVNKTNKRIISVMADICLLAVIILAVYMLVVDNFISININLLYIIIIAAIPTGFYFTYMSFAKDIDWEAPYKDDEQEEAEEETGDEIVAENEENTGVTETGKTDV